MRIVFSYKDGPKQVIERPLKSDADALRALARKIKWRLGLRG